MVQNPTLSDNVATSVVSSSSPEVTDWTEDDETIERRTLETAINEANERLNLKMEMRGSNNKDKIKYPEETFFFKLDSSIKKNSAFVKKLRNLTEGQRESILKDMSGLNLSKYISEVASALVDAKIKMSDINLSLKISSEMHQRYPEFSSTLLDTWIKTFPKKPTDLSNINSSKLRIDVRLFAELIASGIFTPKEGLPPFGQLLTLLTVNDKDNHCQLSVILSFCKYCADDYLGIIPRKIRLLSEKYQHEFPKSDFITSERQKSVRNLMKDYYKSLVVHVLKDHKSLQNQNIANRKILLTRGELSTERREKYEADQLAFNKLFQLAQQLADSLDEDEIILPPTPAHLEDPLEGGGVDISNRFKGGVDFDTSSLWEDEDTKTFYESLPDIKELIPSILYKDSIKEPTKSSEQKVGEEVNKESEGLDDDVDIEKEIESTNVVCNDLLIEDDEIEEDPKDEPVGATKKVSNKILMDTFLSSLLTCVNRDMIDKAAINFCTNLNTKFNRKKLVRALFTVPRTRLDLLPFYARFVKTVEPVMSHVAEDLVQLLRGDFRFHVKKKDQINIESKIKNVRYIGELVKFTVFPKNEAILCLRMLLHDFAHHQIEMTCNLLETCGRFLHRSPESHHKLELLLEQMMRKKSLLYNSRYVTMIENAYYSTNPDESVAAIPRVERPPLHQYARKLLYVDLNRGNVDKILKQLRKFDWNDAQVSGYLLKCFFSVWKVKFPNIRFLANLLSGLERYQDWTIPVVVDAVLEDIRLMMEINLPKYNQRRIAMVKYLGEMYNYRLVDSSLIFKELYSFITFGVYYEFPDYVSDLDPPDNLFRLRLITQLLDVCSQYLTAPSTKKKLDCYIYYFQRYYWFKRENKYWSLDGNTFPVSIQYLVEDCLYSLRPKFKMAKSYEESNKLVEKMIEDLKPKALELYPEIQNPQIRSNSINGTTPEPDSLNAIPEENEDVQSSDYIGDYPLEFREEDEDMLSQTSTSQRGGLNSGARTQNTPSDDDEEDNYSPEQLTNEEGKNYSSDFDHDSTKVAPKHVPCPEDDDFLRDFDKLMTESINTRGTGGQSGSVIQIPVDATISSSVSITPKAQKKTFRYTFDDTSSGEDEEDFEENTINLMVMTRPAKGNKPVLKTVGVSKDSELGKSILQKEEAERNEKLKLKKLTLDMTERLEEAEISSSAPQITNFNREQRRFQHPKGAPDADLIFGSKR